MANAILLDGPRLPPASGGQPKALVALFHGFGSNGDDLIGLAPLWAKALPGAQFVAPDAPEPAVGAPPGGRQWFPLSRIDPHQLEGGVRAAAALVDRFLDRELQRYGLRDDQLALVGFSQGAMLALHVGLRRAAPPAAIVGLSGLLVGPGSLKEEARGRPPILLVHGSHDDVIPVAAMFAAAEALGEAGLGAQWHVSHGAPHTVAQDGVELAGGFLQAALAGRLGAGR